MPIINNTARVKQVNVELVKTALKALTCGTKLTIANATGLSVATCGNILNELLDRGEVMEADFEQPNGGRPARRFMYNANFAYIACIYVSNEGGVCRTTHAITNLMGEIIEEQSIVVNVINYDVIDHLIETLIAKYENIKALGIGIPGIVQRGIIGDGDITELIHVPLAAQLQAKYNLEITVENDMNLTVYGFYQAQNYEEDQTIAVVIFPQNNCAGAGIMVDGHIMRGATNFAGEVSYLPFDRSLEQPTESLTISPFMVKTIASIIAIINPKTIVITGGQVPPQRFEDLAAECAKIIPPAHMPQFILQEDMQTAYLNGLIALTLESLACDIQLIEKRI